MLRDIFLMSRPPLLCKEGNAAAAKVVGNSFTGSMTAVSNWLALGVYVSIVYVVPDKPAAVIS
jgi:hypothetical protein